MSNFVPNIEAFQKAKTWEAGGFFKSASGAITFRPATGISLISEVDPTDAKNTVKYLVLGGVKRKVSGLFVNTVDDQLNFLSGLGGKEAQITTLNKRKAGGLSSILKANLEA